MSVVILEEARTAVSKVWLRVRRCLWQSFETRLSKSAVADFDISDCRSRASPTSVAALGMRALIFSQNAASYPSLRLGALRVHDGGADHDGLAIAQDGQLGRIANPKQSETAAQLGRIPHRNSCEVDHHIAGFKTCNLGRRAGIDLGDDRRGRRRSELIFAHQSR